MDKEAALPITILWKIKTLKAPQKYGTVNGGYATRKEYYITLNMAKELAMEQNVDYGGSPLWRTVTKNFVG